MELKDKINNLQQIIEIYDIAPIATTIKLKEKILNEITECLNGTLKTYKLAASSFHLNEKIEFEEAILAIRKIYFTTAEKWEHKLSISFWNYFPLPDNYISEFDLRWNKFEDNIDEIKVKIEELERTLKQQKIFKALLVQQEKELERLNVLHESVSDLKKMNILQSHNAFCATNEVIDTAMHFQRALNIKSYHLL